MIGTRDYIKFIYIPRRKDDEYELTKLIIATTENDAVPSKE